MPQNDQGLHCFLFETRVSAQRGDNTPGRGHFLMYKNNLIYDNDIR